MNSLCPETEMATRFHQKNEPLKHQGLDTATVGAGERRIISVSGRVIQFGKDFVWVETERKSGCAHCSARLGCGIADLTKFLGRRANRIRVPNRLNASLGDGVILGISETALIKGTFMLYLLPLLSMLVPAVVMNVMVNSEELTVLAAVCGLFAGLALVRYLALRNATDNALQPFMLTCKQAGESTKKA